MSENSVMVRVSPDIREKVMDGAKAFDVSSGDYLRMLLDGSELDKESLKKNSQIFDKQTVLQELTYKVAKLQKASNDVTNEEIGFLTARLEAVETKLDQIIDTLNSFRYGS
jgi:hypothetical protein